MGCLLLAAEEMQLSNPLVQAWLEVERWELPLVLGDKLLQHWIPVATIQKENFRYFAM